MKNECQEGTVGRDGFYLKNLRPQQTAGPPEVRMSEGTSKRSLPQELEAQFKKAKNDPLYGEERCTQEKCKNKGYYSVSGKVFCGVHSKKKDRTELKKRDKKSTELLNIQKKEREIQEIREAQEANKNEGKKGEVILTRLFMMKPPEDTKGFLKVFPNYKHQNRSDGFGCASLSPKFMGPIKHGQPGLPDSKNLENFHQ